MRASCASHHSENASSLAPRISAMSISNLCTDQLDLGEGEGEQARRALVLRKLAQKYQVPRLELLCAQALQKRVGPLPVAYLFSASARKFRAQCRLID